MKLSTTSAALALALASSVAAAPTALTTENGLSKREMNNLNLAIADMEHLTAKRDLMTEADIAKREYEIVTQVLEAISNSGLAPKIIVGLVTDPTLGPITSKAIITILKSGLIDLTTLLKGIVDSGIVNSVIEGLISDCQFYAQIYKLALSYISDLVGQLTSKLGSSKRELLSAEPVFDNIEKVVRADDDDGIVSNLLDSLKKSGLATNVVKTLLTDKAFLNYGASLIKEIIESKAISVSELINAIKESGLVPSLFKEFFNFETLKTVTVNALAAAFGNCDGSSVTSSIGTSATTTITQKQSDATVITATSTATGVNCKKRRRRRSYNY